MYKLTLLVLGIAEVLAILLFFCACRNKPKKDFPEAEKGDNIIHITTINNAEDTLFQIRNTTKGRLKIYYKGDSIFLLQDSVGFSNKNYVLTEQNNETILRKKGKIIFQNPVK